MRTAWRCERFPRIRIATRGHPACSGAVASRNGYRSRLWLGDRSCRVVPWAIGDVQRLRGAAQERACALRLAQRAAILDSDDPLVLTARCAVHTMAGEFDVADALLARALELDPTSGWAWGRSGWLNSYLGNSEVAIEHFRRAISLEPSSPSNANNYVGIGSAHFGAGRYHAAAAWMRKALLEQPGTLWANRTLSVSYARLGERLKALESLETLRRYCPDLTVGRVVDAIPFRQDHLNRLGADMSDLGCPRENAEASAGGHNSPCDGLASGNIASEADTRPLARNGWRPGNSA